MFSWKKFPKQFFGQCNLYLKNDLNIHTPLKTRAIDSYWKETDLLTDNPFILQSNGHCWVSCMHVLAYNCYLNSIQQYFKTVNPTLTTSWSEAPSFIKVVFFLKRENKWPSKIWLTVQRSQIPSGYIFWRNFDCTLIEMYASTIKCFFTDNGSFSKMIGLSVWTNISISNSYKKIKSNIQTDFFYEIGYGYSDYGIYA